MDLREGQKQDCWYKDVCALKSCVLCERYIQMKFLMDNSGIPKNRQIPVKLFVQTIEDNDSFHHLARIREDITEFVKAGKNLFICSNNTGNGKTSWALKLMLRYFNNIWNGNAYRIRGIFINTFEFLCKVKNFDSYDLEEYKQNILNADLVIWDDFATVNKLSDFEVNMLLHFIDSRMFEQKSNIFTSNVTTEKELSSKVGSRLSSRILGNSDFVKIIGGDNRKDSGGNQ